jgi:hypothetical protein
MPSIKTCLILAKSLIENHGWCQGTFAKDDCGRTVNSLSPEATSFCIAGACSRAAHTARSANNYLGMLRRLRQHLQGIPPAEFNDVPGRTKEEVLALFDKAIGDQDD